MKVKQKILGVNIYVVPEYAWFPDQKKRYCCCCTTAAAALLLCVLSVSPPNGGRTIYKIHQPGFHRTSRRRRVPCALRRWNGSRRIFFKLHNNMYTPVYLLLEKELHSGINFNPPPIGREGTLQEISGNNGVRDDRSPFILTAIV